MPDDRAPYLIAERPEHREAIAQLLDAAFGGNYESRLVERLRADDLVAASLVVVDGRQLLGHILFSGLMVTVDGQPVNAVSLAPMAVRPDVQRMGIGSRLVRVGLRAMQAQQRQAVIVVGHPHYYPRFGFSSALTRHLRSPYAGEACMAVELAPGALAGQDGEVKYPPAFDQD